MLKFLSTLTIFTLFISQLNAFSIKPKLAIMEIQDKTGTFNKETLDAAAEYLRTGFIASGKYVVISKERQNEAKIKALKKESYKKCYDKTCQIPLGQALSADTLLNSSITKFGGTFTFSVELIDLAKEATVKGANAEFDGTEKGLKNAMDKIINKLTIQHSSTQSQSEDIQIGGVNLANMPNIQIEQENFEALNNDSKPEISSLQTSSSNLDNINADLLVLYDNAVNADKNGKQNPQKAIDNWKQVLNIQKNNPYLDTAKTRIVAWEKFLAQKKARTAYKNAVNADKNGKMFPSTALNAWKKVLEIKNNNPYFKIAQKRFSQWSNFITKLNQYEKIKKKFIEQRKKDRAKMMKILPLSILSKQQKTELILKYAEIYSPYYKFSDTISLLNAIKNKKEKEDLKMALKSNASIDRFKEECNQKNASACFILGEILNLQKDLTSESFYKKSCLMGIPNACKTISKILLSSKSKEAEIYLKKGCELNDKQACFLLAKSYEQGIFGQKSPIFVQKFFNKSCLLGIKQGCNHRVKLKLRFNTNITKNNPIKKNIKYERPLFWYGIFSLALSAGAVGAGFYFDKDMKTQLDKRDRVSNIYDFNNYDNNAKTDKTLRLISYISAGVFATTGTVFMFIKTKKEKKSAFNFIINPKQIYASYTIKF